MLGTATRLAQEAGARLKRRKDVETWTLDDELKIRAFWSVGLKCVLHFLLSDFQDTCRYGHKYQLCAG